MSEMYGLAVRWSLRGAPDDVAQKLRDYVRDTSLAKFSGVENLRFKTWRMIEGEWFEGVYVWDGADARDGFETAFRRDAATAPVSLLVGAAPALVEPFEVVAVAEGPSGFVSGVGPVAAG